MRSGRGHVPTPRIGQRRARPRWSRGPRGARRVGLQPIVRDALCVRRKWYPKLCVFSKVTGLSRGPAGAAARGSPGGGGGWGTRQILERTRERRGSRRAQAGRRETVKAEIHVGHGRSQTRVCTGHTVGKRKGKPPKPVPEAAGPAARRTRLCATARRVRGSGKWSTSAQGPGRREPSAVARCLRAARRSDPRALPRARPARASRTGSGCRPGAPRLLTLQRRDTGLHSSVFTDQKMTKTGY